MLQGIGHWALLQHLDPPHIKGKGGEKKRVEN